MVDADRQRIRRRHIVPDGITLAELGCEAICRAALLHIDGVFGEADGRGVAVDAAHPDHFEALVAGGIRGGDGKGAVLGEGDLIIAARGGKLVCPPVPCQCAGLIDGSGDRDLVVALVLDYL